MGWTPRTLHGTGLCTEWVGLLGWYTLIFQIASFIWIDISGCCLKRGEVSRYWLHGFVFSLREMGRSLPPYPSDWIFLLPIFMGRKDWKQFLNADSEAVAKTKMMRTDVEFSAICEFGHLRVEESEGSEDWLLEYNFLVLLETLWVSNCCLTQQFGFLRTFCVLSRGAVAVFIPACRWL